MKNDFSITNMLTRVNDVLSAKASVYGDTFKHVDALHFVDIAFVKARRCLQIMNGYQPKVDESMYETLNDILGYCIAFFNKTHWADLDDLYAAKNEDYGEVWKSLHPLYLCEVVVVKLDRHRRKPNQPFELSANNPKLHSDVADVALYVMFILWHLDNE